MERLLAPTMTRASLAAALALVFVAAARAQPVVQVDRAGEAYRVSVRLSVTSDRQTAWNVLTDYDNLARFVPGMRSSRIISAPGQPKLLEQKGESGLGFVKVSTTTVSRLQEIPMQSIRFESVSGNLKSMRGEWSLEGHDHATAISYRAEVVPGFALPPLIGPALMSQNIRDMVEGVAREIEGRTAR